MPTSGMIGKHIDWSLSEIKATLRKADGIAYSYVLTTVEFNHDEHRFEQHGSGPNFQGGRLTLCTCKHQMRSRRSTDGWEGVWLVGLTSRTKYDGRHWLFYLAKVESAHDSHSDLWSNLDAGTRKAKSASLRYLGDVYEPKEPMLDGKSRFSPSRYRLPLLPHAHRQNQGDTGWHRDIEYEHPRKDGTTPLLVADPAQTFLWKEPKIFFAESRSKYPKDHCRDYLKWPSQQGFGLLDHLQEERR